MNEEKQELLPEELLYDERFKDQFMAIREDRLEGERLVGSIVAVGMVPDEVHAKLKQDQKDHPNSKYLFAKPIESGFDTRQHYTITKEK